MFEKDVESKGLMETVSAMVELGKAYLVMANNIHKSVSNIEFRGEMEFKLLNELIDKALTLNDEIFNIANAYEYESRLSPELARLMRDITSVSEDEDVKPKVSNSEKLSKIFPPEEKEEKQ